MEETVEVAQEEATVHCRGCRRCYDDDDDDDNDDDHHDDDDDVDDEFTPEDLIRAMAPIDAVIDSFVCQVEEKKEEEEVMEGNTGMTEADADDANDDYERFPLLPAWADVDGQNRFAALVNGIVAGRNDLEDDCDDDYCDDDYCDDDYCDDDDDGDDNIGDDVDHVVCSEGIKPGGGKRVVAVVVVPDAKEGGATRRSLRRSRRKVRSIVFRPTDRYVRRLLLRYVSIIERRHGTMVQDDDLAELLADRLTSSSFSLQPRRGGGGGGVDDAAPDPTECCYVSFRLPVCVKVALRRGGGGGCGCRCGAIDGASSSLRRLRHKAGAKDATASFSSSSSSSSPLSSSPPSSSPPSSSPPIVETTKRRSDNPNVHGHQRYHHLLGIRIYPYHNDVGVRRAWEAGCCLAEYLTVHPNHIRGRDVVELGSGVGLTGIVAAGMCRPNTVHMTDWTCACLDNLKHNVEANRKWLKGHGMDASNVTTGYLDWSIFTNEHDVPCEGGRMGITLCHNDDAAAPAAAVDDGCDSRRARSATSIAALSSAHVVIGADLAYDVVVLPSLAVTLRWFLLSERLSSSSNNRHNHDHDHGHGEEENVAKRSAIIATTYRNKLTFDLLRTEIERNGGIDFMQLDNLDDDLPRLFPCYYQQPRSDVRIWILRGKRLCG